MVLPDSIKKGILMAKFLVIVESPTKVKTINKILGQKYKVVPSMGHLVDLPASSLGVDIENNFEPRLIVVRKKQKVLTRLKKDAKNKKHIFIATDPDREGEAIGWNIAQHLGDGKEYHRVTFHEITKDAVSRAFQHPVGFDAKKIDAQLARRILDRLVGYKLSPLLWKKVGSRLSAGRVQSVALRLIVEREREIQNFVPQEYWQITVDLKKEGNSQILSAALEKIDNEKVNLTSREQTDTIVDQLKKEAFYISDVSQKEIKRKAPPPFITSTMQQEAFNKLGFNTAKTMMIAQQLYEGIDIGDESVGLITYMRTDSVNIAKEALEKVRAYIQKHYGLTYLPQKANTFKSRKSAQEAHEAIRPTDVNLAPEEIKKYLTEDQYELYSLIWRRFISCQMTPAVYKVTKLSISSGNFLLGASGSTRIFDGYLATGIDMENEEKGVDLGIYLKGDKLQLVEIRPTQHFTKPPPRYSEGSLVRALEENGIGRPSTYAPIIQTLVLRNYVRRDRGYFNATELGMKICDLLIEYFPKIMDISFTATMEEHLDLIEEGKLDKLTLLEEFYQPFREELAYALENIEKTREYVDRTCPKCGRPMMVKWGRNGKFLSCSGFPKCKYSEAFLTGIKCPREGCDGEVVERRSRRGQRFYGCSNYPKCNFISNKLPEETDKGSKE